MNFKKSIILYVSSVLLGLYNLSGCELNKPSEEKVKYMVEERCGNQFQLDEMVLVDNDYNSNQDKTHLTFKNPLNGLEHQFVVSLRSQHEELFSRTSKKYSSEILDEEVVDRDFNCLPDFSIKYLKGQQVELFWYNEMGTIKSLAKGTLNNAGIINLRDEKTGKYILKVSLDFAKYNALFLLN